jgi:hypothetical protein
VEVLSAISGLRMFAELTHRDFAPIKGGVGRGTPHPGARLKPQSLQG